MWFAISWPRLRISVTRCGYFSARCPITKKVARAWKRSSRSSIFDGVSGRGAVIDREPDFRLRGVERSDDRSPPLAIGHERRVEQQEMGDERSARARGRDSFGEVKCRGRAPRRRTPEERAGPSASYSSRDAGSIAEKPGRWPRPGSSRPPPTRWRRVRAATGCAGVTPTPSRSSKFPTRMLWRAADLESSGKVRTSREHLDDH